MHVSKIKASLMIGAVIASRLVGCSPSNGNDGTGNGGGNAVGFGGNGNGNGASPGTGNFTNQGSGADIGFFGPDSSAAGQNGGGSSGTSAGCGVKTKPEEILTYHDASVTDTITTYSPVALYIMQDRSGSMVTGFPEGSAQSWANSTAAISGFVGDPATQTLDVGLGFFPPVSNNQGACDGSDCGQPVVEIAPVSKNGPALTAAYNNSTPQPLNFTPTECALRGAINHCLQWQSTSNEQCVVILVTDGNPTTCDTTTSDLVAIVTDGKTKGVTTFALGLPGSTIAFLNQLAQAGGTTAAIDVSGGTSAFIAALNAIRQKVSKTSVSHHTTQTVVSAPLPCEWNIPPPPMGQQFDKNKVNMTFTPKGGAAQNFGYVAVADCPRATNGWYYDDPNNPKKVFACPTTCDALKASTGAEIDVSFGCAQIPAVLH
jgi:hypothetical protein